MYTFDFPSLKKKMVTAWGFPLHYFLAWLNSSFSTLNCENRKVFEVCLKCLSFLIYINNDISWLVWVLLHVHESFHISSEAFFSWSAYMYMCIYIYFKQCSESFVFFSLHCSKIFVRPCRNEYILIPILHFIHSQDYEYASYNPIAFDIANHFCEMAANYHSETPHVLDYSKYPGNFLYFCHYASPKLPFPQHVKY